MLQRHTPTNKQQTHTHTRIHTGKLAASSCCIFNCVLHIWIVFIYLNSQLHFSHYFCYYTDAFNDSIVVCVCVWVCTRVCAHYLCIGGWLSQHGSCVFCVQLFFAYLRQQTGVLCWLHLPLSFHSSHSPFSSRSLCLCVVCIIIVCCMQQRVNISIYSACLKMLMLIRYVYVMQF